MRRIRKNEKIFAIGFNKTATTTIHQILLDYGFKAFHGKNYDTEQFDAFSDGSIDSISRYEEYHADFPGALFVLNIRPFHSWCLSRFKHGFVKACRQHGIDWRHLDTKPQDLKKIIETAENWAWPPAVEKVEKWGALRSQHHSAVLDYFSSKTSEAAFICFDIECPGWQHFFETRVSEGGGKIGRRRNTIATELIHDKALGHMISTINEARAGKVTQDNPNLFKNSLGVASSAFESLASDERFFI